MIGSGSRAFFGAKISVLSRTPSRIAIITFVRTYVVSAPGGGGFWAVSGAARMKDASVVARTAKCVRKEFGIVGDPGGRQVAISIPQKLTGSRAHKLTSSQAHKLTSSLAHRPRHLSRSSRPLGRRSAP